MAAAHRMVILAYDKLCAFEFSLAREVLSSGPSDPGSPWYRTQVCAMEPGPVRAAGGLVLEPQHGPEALATADTILIPGWSMEPVPTPLSDALVAAHAAGARIASICTGAFVLAAAGLLGGRRATTHWRYADRLAAEYPSIEVDSGVLYVDEGDVVTSAGSAAGIDMLLHLIRRDYGAKASNAVARGMVVPPHRDGGQAQFFERPVPTTAHSPLGLVIDHMRRNASRELRIEELAKRAAMSPRTFFRKFREATGEAPYDWLLRQRIAIAKELLEDSNLSIDRIAHEAGLGSADTLRHHFRKQLGMAPNRFRRTFSAGAGSPQLRQ
jgi:AraC family transcriptional activator FtrA